MGKTKAKLKILLEDTLLSNYWNGFIMADGSIKPQPRLVIGLSIKDYNHLLKFATLINTKISIGKKDIHIQVMDKNILKELVKKFDYHNNKTINPPDISIFRNMTDDIFLSFLMGFIDGDGCIHNIQDHQQVNIGLVSHCNWLNIFNYWYKRLQCIINISFGGAPKIDSRGHLRWEISNSIVIKFLKNKSLEFKLPVMERKWEKVNLLYVGRNEKYLYKVNFIEENLNLSMKEIAVRLQISLSNVYQILKRRNIPLPKNRR